jgi:iron complex outermembrane receptor protein
MGFNTPEWTINIQFGNRQITKNSGFSVVHRWQKKFFWEIPLVNGYVSDIQTFDA